MGEHSQFEDVKQSPVGFFYEGIDLSEEASVFKFLPCSRARVRSHSQPLDFGSKGLGGVVLVENRSQGSCGEGRLGLQVGSQEHRGTILSTPVLESDSYQFTATALVQQSEGFINNEYLNRKTGERKEWNLFASGQFRSGVWSFDHHHFFAHHDNGYDHWSRNFDFDSQSDNPGKDQHRVHGHSFKIYRDFDDFRLHSQTAFTGSLQEESFDEDWGNDDFWRRLPGWEDTYNYRSGYDRDRKKLHQNFSFLHGSGLDLNLHYYYFQETQNIFAFKDSEVRRQVDSRVTNQSLALTASKDFVFAGNQLLTWGHRLERQWLRLDEDTHSVDNATSDFLWAGSVAWSFPVAKNFLSQLLMTRAFRGGGFNTNFRFEDDKRSFGAEDLTSLEWIGQIFKNHRLHVFHNWRRNQQVKISQQDDPMDPSSYTFFTDNVAATSAYGLEFFSSFDLGKSLSLGMSIGLLRTEFQDLQLAGVDLSGRALADAPESSFNMGLDYEPVEALKLHLGLSGKGRRFFSNSHNQQAEAYELLRAGLEWDFKPISLRIWAQNILDRKYATRGFYFANDPPNWPEQLYRQRGEPRTFGMELAYVF